MIIFQQLDTPARLIIRFIRICFWSTNSGTAIMKQQQQQQHDPCAFYDQEKMTKNIIITSIKPAVAIMLFTSTFGEGRWISGGFNIRSKSQWQTDIWDGLPWNLTFEILQFFAFLHDVVDDENENQQRYFTRDQIRDDHNHADIRINFRIIWQYIRHMSDIRNAHQQIYLHGHP